MDGETLVVIERGARWPTFLGIPGEAGSDATLLVQGDDESSADFRARGFSAISSADLLHAPRLGVLVMNEDGDEEAFQTRQLLLRALVRHVELHRAAGVILVADGSTDVRSAAADLALRLNEEHENRGSSVRIRFRAQPRTLAPPAWDEDTSAGQNVA